jgi:hypothetical protein
VNHSLHSNCIVLKVCLHFRNNGDVTTRRMVAAVADSTTPPLVNRIDCPNTTFLFNTVVPHSAATVPLLPPMQRPETKPHRIVNISDITRIRLRLRIKKIKDMSSSVVDGYGTFYLNKHGVTLPQETAEKIMLLYDNRIERRCIEVGLTVEEEKEWDYDDAKVDVDALSESGEESEKHDSDDVCFYSDKDNDDDDDNIGLSFEELKQRQREQAFQQCIDRDGPLAKAMLEMIENPPPPFESSEDDQTTNNALIGKRKRNGNTRGKTAN